MMEYLKLGLENKDFITAIMVVGILGVIIMPLVYFIIKVLEKNLVKAIKELGENIKKTFDEHEKLETVLQKNLESKITTHMSESKRQNIELQMKMGNTVLDTEQTIKMLIEKMAYVSQNGKLNAIEQILTVNHIAGRKAEITEKVKNELARQSDYYIKDFKEFTTPVGDLSHWLDKNFNEKDFDKFINEIVEIMYSDAYRKRIESISTQNNEELVRTMVIKNKVNDIATLMKNLQVNLSKKLRKDIEEFNI